MTALMAINDLLNSFDGLLVDDRWFVLLMVACLAGFVAFIWKDQKHLRREEEIDREISEYIRRQRK